MRFIIHKFCVNRKLYTHRRFFTTYTNSLTIANKYNYNFVINILRACSPLIDHVLIQNYSLKELSLVDIYLFINYKDLLKVCGLFSKSLLFFYEQLINITCIDNLLKKSYREKKKRFTLVYLLNSINTTSRIFISCSIDVNTILFSLSSIFKAALWLEREIFDLFGLYFVFHNDLRRILTDYGFKGFPLRKDFPLTGYIELRFREGLKTLFYSKLIFIQEVRFFRFSFGKDNYLKKQL